MTTPDKLERALEALQSQTTEPDAPPEVIQQTLTALSDHYECPGFDTNDGSHRSLYQSRWRWAAAAMVLLVLGLLVGQFSAQHRMERQLGQWQQQVAADLRNDLLQTQQAQLIQVAQQFDQGLSQRFNEFASGTLAVSRASQQQFCNAVRQAFYRGQQRQSEQLEQLLGQWQNQQSMQNAVLADGLVTVADVAQLLLTPEQQVMPTRFIELDPNSLQH